MLTIKKCEKILNKKGKNYTEEQIKEIAKFIEIFAKITIENYNNYLSHEKCSNNVSSK